MGPRMKPLSWRLKEVTYYPTPVIMKTGYWKDWLLERLVIGKTGYWKDWLLERLVIGKTGYWKDWLLERLITFSVFSYFCLTLLL
jgi:hypothetical protein